MKIIKTSKDDFNKTVEESLSEISFYSGALLHTIKYNRSEHLTAQ